MPRLGVVSPPVAMPRRSTGKGNAVVFFAAGAVTLVTMVVVLAVVATKQNIKTVTTSNGSSSATSSDGFQLSYKLAGESLVTPTVDAFVKGKAAKVAVILKNPDGQEKKCIIKEDDMVTNSGEAYFGLVGAEDPKPGAYVLTAKTFAPEKVVCQLPFTLSLEKIDIESVEPCFEGSPGFTVTMAGDGSLCALKIALRKKGNLPVFLNNCTGSFMDSDGSCKHFTASVCSWMVDSEGTYTADLMGFTSDCGSWKPGDHFKLSGSLNFGLMNTSVDPIKFEKELIVR
jgi:hypothetical protein